MRTPDVHRHLLLAAGQANGGLLSERDLDDAVPADEPAVLVPAAPDLRVALPVQSTDVRGKRRGGGSESGRLRATIDRPPSSRPVHHVVAADSRGIVAALAWAPDLDGLLVPALGLRLARDAVPVMRGVVRVTPGTPRPVPAPIAVLSRPASGWFAAVGLEGAASLDARHFEAAPAVLRDLLERLVDRAGARTASAASVQRRRTTLTRVLAR
jgi:gamma-glutamyltranspeptidase/glutathione hydrolase